MARKKNVIKLEVSPCYSVVQEQKEGEIVEGKAHMEFDIESVEFPQLLRPKNPVPFFEKFVEKPSDISMKNEIVEEKNSEVVKPASRPSSMPNASLGEERRNVNWENGEALVKMREERRLERELRERRRAEREELRRKKEAERERYMKTLEAEARAAEERKRRKEERAQKQDEIKALKQAEEKERKKMMKVKRKLRAERKKAAAMASNGGEELIKKEEEANDDGEEQIKMEEETINDGAELIKKEEDVEVAPLSTILSSNPASRFRIRETLIPVAVLLPIIFLFESFA